ncbi:MAG: metallophosphoesterase [Syntrophales bacterium]|nr:metallophosphoesterase [Syntrophales bacterium]MDD5233319.1 metallophosphoesterase [Syntrophales bacterium]MDD5531163.1 metallophosphoesterase [Syntrophales bacterium]
MTASRLRLMLFLPVLILPAAFGIAFLETNSIEIRYCLIEDARLGGVLDGIRLALISDLHSGETGSRERLLAGILRDESPDMLMLAGDYASKKGNYGPVNELMEKVRCPLGVYAVLGNAEYAHPGRYCALCHERGSKKLKQSPGRHVLRNSVTILERKGNRLYIIGLDDPVTGRKDGRSARELREIAENLDPRIPKILLAHSPEIFDEAVRLGIDLVLCGHTHGGQLFFVPMLPWMKKSEPSLTYPAGFYQRGRTTMYVSRGIGVNVLPFRLGVRPEVAVIRFSGGAEGAGAGVKEEKRKTRFAGFDQERQMSAPLPKIRKPAPEPHPAGSGAIDLINFESEAAERDLDWECGKWFERNPFDTASQRKGLRAVLPPGPRATIRVIPALQDWSGHEYLNLEILSLCRSRLNFCLRIDDRPEPVYADRYENCRPLDPGMNRIAVPVGSIRSNDGSRKLDLEKISRIILSFPDEISKEVHLCRIRLEKSPAGLSAPAKTPGPE